MILPERLLRAGFTQPYQTATMAVIVPDHRRVELDKLADPQMRPTLRLGAVHDDVAAAAKRLYPHVEIEAIDSLSSFFTGARRDLAGLIIPAEEGAVWNILYPNHTVVVPQPVMRRPVGMAVRLKDADWLRFPDRWLDFERLDGSLDRTRAYWIEGRGTQKRPPRWCILRDVLHWLP